MASKCKKCGSEDHYNFALNIDLCDPCIGEELEALRTKNERLKKKKGDVFEICIPNLRPDEVQYVRNQVNKFTQELLNVLTEQRNRKN